MMSSIQFKEVFRRATGNDPLHYQERLALSESFPTLLDVPTGLGKTSAAVLAWIWCRRFADENIRKQTPRRLIYCLPMRVLVEQTYGEAVKWLDRLGLLAGLADWTEDDSAALPTDQSQLKRDGNGEGRGYNPDPPADFKDERALGSGDKGQHPIAVHLLLGGEEKSDWALWPERDAILIGTQDMLISRALNRGYAAGRARWPLEFGLLNSDCLWVFDEIQIMDTGLATSLQLDAWRRSLRLRSNRDAFLTANEKHLARPCHSLWMSATMSKHWLERAVDWSPKAAAEWGDRQQLSQIERTDVKLRSGQLFQIRKQLRPAPIAALERPKTKADVDVSRYIRDGEELDVQVFWRDISNDENPERWEPLEFGSVDQVVYPGQVFLLEKSCGGYSSELGWTGDQRHADFELPQHLASAKAIAQDDDDDDEPPAKAPEEAWRRDRVNSSGGGDQRRPGFRHELASALAILETLCFAESAHKAFAWPDGLDKAQFGGESANAATFSVDGPLVQELAELSAAEVDLLVYLVASHHGKVRMSLRSSPDDERDDVPDPCPADKRQARGVRDGDTLPSCQLPAADLNADAIVVPEITLWLDLMELGLSSRFGASWRERMQLLLERLGPFRLGYLEALLRAADCRASMEEDAICTGLPNDSANDTNLQRTTQI